MILEQINYKLLYYFLHIIILEIITFSMVLNTSIIVLPNSFKMYANLMYSIKRSNKSMERKA